MKWTPILHHTKINSKWIKDLSIRPETIKLLEENIRGKLLETGLGNDFLDLTPKAKSIKAKINQVELHQTKKLLHSKGKHQQNKVQPTEWKKIFANHVSNKWLISKISMEFN